MLHPKYFWHQNFLRPHPKKKKRKKVKNDFNITILILFNQIDSFMHDFASELMKLVCSFMSLHPSTCSTLHIPELNFLSFLLYVEKFKWAKVWMWSVKWSKLKSPSSILFQRMKHSNQTQPSKRNEKKKTNLKWRQRQMRGTWVQDRPNIRELWKDSIKMADVDDRGSVGDEQEGGKDLWYWDQKCLCIEIKSGKFVIMVP